MKVLWVCKGPVPEASKAFGLPVSAKEGWLVNVSDRMGKQPGIDFALAFFSEKLAQPCEMRRAGATAFWGIKSASDAESIRRVLKIEAPDVVHIWGTENEAAMRVMEACIAEGIAERAVISIQGLVGFCSQHYMGNLPWAAQVVPTLRDVVRRDTLLMQQRRFAKRGEYEARALRLARHAIGRTTWDYACATEINPEIQYHFNNETLRPSFYRHRWDMGQCERYSIFASQAQYPLKGFHNVIEALPAVLRRFPEAKVYVAGENNAFKGGLLRTAYGAYLVKRMRALGVTDRVRYVGMLQEEEMCAQFLKAHVFVSPSSIENSPNSVGEAMLLGMPVVSSAVGGVGDLMSHGVEGYLYQSDAPYMLSHYVCKVFEDDENARRLGESANIRARSTHDPDVNFDALLAIYRGIIAGGA